MNIDFSLFHFLRPQWFWAFIPLVALIIAARYLIKQRSGWQGLLANHLYQHLMTTEGNKRPTPPLSLLALGWILAVFALAGPTWEKLPQPVYQLNTGKVVLMDMSMSMRSTDIIPDRLTRAKFKAIDLVEAITEGETGLVAYAGDAFVISPLTSDAQNLASLIPSLTPEIMPVPGSDVIYGLDKASELLVNAGYQQGEIFLITDGIELSEMEPIREFAAASNYRLSILGVGTEEGAPIKLSNGDFLKDYSGAIVVPKLTTSNLRIIARTGNGRYAPMQSDNSDIDFLINQTLIDQDENSEQEESNQGDQWEEMGPYLLLLLLPIAAYSFRRGLAFILVICFLPLYPNNAQANWWDDLWLTKDQQGQAAFKKEEFDNAAQQFNDPSWKGSSHYRSGNYEAAVEEYSKLETPDAHYNRGNALAQLGEIDAAIDAYNQTLSQQPDHEDALANKELLEKQKQEQEQEQQQQDSESSDDNQEQSDSEQQDQQSGEQNDQDQQQSDQDSQSQNEPQDQNEGEESDNQESQESEEQQQESEEQKQEEADQEQQQAEGEEQQAQAEPEELTDEQKEQLQRLENLLRKVPDDPSFLLKQKMLLENQKRRRSRVPGNREKNW
jgi:Ca-activated chloride channel family protein